MKFRSESKTILFVHAHPDDESLWSGPLIAKFAEAGANIAVMFATTGSRGKHRITGVSGESLSKIRREEAHAACSILGVTQVIWYLNGNVTDSGARISRNGKTRRPFFVSQRSLLKHGFPEFAKNFRVIVESLRPQAIITYPADGITGHPDHVHLNKLLRKYWSAYSGITEFWELTSDYLKSDLTIEARNFRDIGNAALSAHRSQIGLFETEGVTYWIGDSGKLELLAGYYEMSRWM